MESGDLSEKIRLGNVKYFRHAKNNARGKRVMEKKLRSKAVYNRLKERP